MTKIERLTSQKHMVTDYLKSVKTHPSADAVYSAVKKKLPRISKATVYRILKNLKAKGEVVELSCRNCQRYDGDTSSHSHFFCEKCRKVYDVPDNFQIPNFKKLKVGEINNYQIHLYGICKKCK